MGTQKILITVKTYPSISTKYDELVCTAGLTEEGKWVRLYPVPFRKMPYTEQYKKYEWIEVDIVKNSSDFRPESFRPYSADTKITIAKKVGTENNWAERKKIVLQNIYTDLSQLIANAKDKSICTSLAVFKPTEIIDFTFEAVIDREWNQAKLAELKQLNLFSSNKNQFKVIQKLPYKFSYKLRDEKGKISKLMIEDWETGQLYWNCLAKYSDEKKACEKVREKYFDDFAKTKDLYFFLGTTKLNHFRAPNPFIIIGTFHPPIDLQGDLFSI